MCTSITYKTLDGYNFLARTLDYDDDIIKELLLIPRSYCWDKKEKRISKYAILGLGIEKENLVGLYDGLNEKGLMCATLVFDETDYSNKNPRKDNLSSCNFVMWILTQFKSINEILENLDSINIILGNANLIDKQIHCKLHWIITDNTFKTIVIEKNKDLNVYNNKYFTLCNEPCFVCQAKNLAQYDYVKPSEDSLGLPGDFSSKSKFVRAAYCRKNINKVYGEINGVTNSFKILDSLQIQKGILEDEFTHITSCMCGKSLKYYYTTYNNRQINMIHLLHEDLNSKRLKKFQINDKQSIKVQN